MEQELNERQKEILRYVVCNFIATAAPVASRYIAKYHTLGLSAATIRNTMADLEEMGYVTHPHTSAGRVPTDKGYRFFVDWLMAIQPLTQLEKGTIKRQLDHATEAYEIFHQAAKLLGLVSHQLSVVASPQLRSCILEHIELLSVSSAKVLVILTVRSGLVKTITMEVTTETNQTNLNYIASILNERLCGLTLEEIRQTVAERVRDLQNEPSGFLSHFLRSSGKIFDDPHERETLHIGGTQSLIEQPEYGDPENIRTVIELINNEKILIEVFERQENEGTQNHGVSISIGVEHKDEKLKNYSIIVTTYTVGGVEGSIGIIGPKRMDYQKVIPVVNFLAQEVTSNLS